MAFIGNHFGPALAAAGLHTKLWLLDHNFNLWGRVYNSLEDPDVFKYVDGIAWHPYVGSVTAMLRMHDAYPGKHQYVTEGGFGAMANLVGPIRFAATRDVHCIGLGVSNTWAYSRAYVANQWLPSYPAFPIRSKPAFALMEASRRKTGTRGSVAGSALAMVIMSCARENASPMRCDFEPTRSSLLNSPASAGTASGLNAGEYTGGRKPVNQAANSDCGINLLINRASVRQGDKKSVPPGS